jgi:hypothetical protein
MTRYGIKPAYEGDRIIVVAPTPLPARGLVNFFCTVVEIEGQEYRLISHAVDATGVTGDPVLIGELLMELIPDRDDMLVLPLLTDPVTNLDGPDGAPGLFKAVAEVMSKNERVTDSFVSDIFEIEQPGFGVVLMRLDTCPDATFRAERHFF